MEALGYNIPADSFATYDTCEYIYQSALMGACKDLPEVPDPEYWFSFKINEKNLIISLHDVIYRVEIEEESEFMLFYRLSAIGNTKTGHLNISIESPEALHDLSYVFTDAKRFIISYYNVNKLPKLPKGLEIVLIQVTEPISIGKLDVKLLLAIGVNLKSIRYPLPMAIRCEKITVEESPRVFSLQDICKYELREYFSTSCDFCGMAIFTIARIQNASIGLPVKFRTCMRCSNKHVDLLLNSYERIGDSIYNNNNTVIVSLGDKQMSYKCNKHCPIREKLQIVMKLSPFNMSSEEITAMLDNNGISKHQKFADRFSTLVLH